MVFIRKNFWKFLEFLWNFFDLFFSPSDQTAVKSRTDVKPSENKAIKASEEIIKKSERKSSKFQSPKLDKLATIKPDSPIPTFENQDDVNFYIAKLLSQNDALKQEIEVLKEDRMLEPVESNRADSTLKEASTEVAKLRVQIGEWQKEIIRKEMEAKETQAKWLKQIQGNFYKEIEKIRKKSEKILKNEKNPKKKIILESEDQVWRAKEELESIVTVKNHELAEKDEQISNLKAREMDFQRDVNKYRIDIMAFIKGPVY